MACESTIESRAAIIIAVLCTVEHLCFVSQGDPLRGLTLQLMMDLAENEDGELHFIIKLVLL